MSDPYNTWAKPERLTAFDIARRIRGTVYHGPPLGLFHACERMLTQAGALFATRVERAGFTFDFFCDGGIAVRFSNGANPEPDLRRYARSDEAVELLLVTCCMGQAACLAGRTHVLSKPLAVARFHWCVHE